MDRYTSIRNPPIHERILHPKATKRSPHHQQPPLSTPRCSPNSNKLERRAVHPPANSDKLQRRSPPPTTGTGTGTGTKPCS
ncbi:hypothetical protein GCM10025331_85920 [Actinoplanes utahensis]